MSFRERSFDRGTQNLDLSVDITVWIAVDMLDTVSVTFHRDHNADCSKKVRHIFSHMSHR